MKVTHVSVFRNSEFGDCTNNGLSSKVNGGYLFWDCTPEEALKYCEENMINPKYQFIIHNRTLFGEDHSYAEPLVKPHGLQMFGGNFIYTSNGLFFHFSGETCGRPIPIHDRFESQEMSNALSV